MRVRFWGTRGSLPVSMTAKDIRGKLILAFMKARGVQLESSEEIERFVDNELGFDIAGTYGGNSSCVELQPADDSHVILDMGSGLRALGNDFLRRFGPANAKTYHVFLSHVHWDHIMGFPFFVPAYIPGNTIVIHTCHTIAEEALRRQNSAPGFPVDYSLLGAKIEFDYLQPDQTYEIEGMQVTPLLQLHAGDSYGWRFEKAGKTLIYSTDSEHKLDDHAERDRFVSFFKGADLVIFDAMYSLAEATSVKADWGHSSNIVAVELCQDAMVKRLAMFHHEPAYSDSQIDSVLKETRRFEEVTRGEHPVEVLSAYDGLEIQL